jgi:hypothetical protein
MDFVRGGRLLYLTDEVLLNDSLSRWAGDILSGFYGFRLKHCLSPVSDTVLAIPTTPGLLRRPRPARGRRLFMSRMLHAVRSASRLVTLYWFQL